jgi:hypothetical protein
MNKLRRTAIASIIANCEAAKALDAEGQKEAASELKDEVECIWDEEQEYLANMFENLRNGERASNAQDAIDKLEEAMGILQELEEGDTSSNRDADFDSCITCLNDAQG